MSMGAGVDITLWPALAAHAPLLAALHAPVFPEEPWSAPALTTLLESPGIFGVIAGDAVGVASGFILARAAADEGEVLTLAVLPAMRRRGIGDRLLTTAMGWLAARGGAVMYLEVAEDNPAALALYHGAGFATVGRRRDYYRRGSRQVAALVLSRALTPEPINPSP